eukprot:scpid4427/ scgid19679/ 
MTTNLTQRVRQENTPNTHHAMMNSHPQEEANSTMSHITQDYTKRMTAAVTTTEKEEDWNVGSTPAVFHFLWCEEARPQRRVERDQYFSYYYTADICEEVGNIRHCTHTLETTLQTN